MLTSGESMLVVFTDEYALAVEVRLVEWVVPAIGSELSTVEPDDESGSRFSFSNGLYASFCFSI